MPLKDCKVSDSFKVCEPVNLYGCSLGEDCFIGPFVEIQKNSSVGDRSRVSSHSFICEGVSIGKDVFVGHGVMFVNDTFDSESLVSWKMKKTYISDKVRIGSNATILPVRIGEGAIVGAGSVVTKDVDPYTVVAGNPAKVLRKI